MRSHGLGRVLRAGAADRALDALASRKPVELVARALRDRQRHHPIERSVSCRSSPTTGRSASGGRSPSGDPRPGCSSRPRPAPMASRLRSRRPGGVCMARDRRGGSPAGNHGVAKAMFLNALECDDAAKSIIKSRAEPSRAEPSRAEPSRAEPSRAEPSRAEPSRAEPSRAEPSRAEPSRAEPSRAEPSRAEPSRAEPSRGAEPSRALGYCLSSSWPPGSLPSAPCGAQSNPLSTAPDGSAPASMRGEAAGEGGRRHRGRSLTACIRRAAAIVMLGCAATLGAGAANADTLISNLNQTPTSS